MYKTIFIMLLGGALSAFSFAASAFEQSFSQLHIRGTNNAWVNSAMTLVDDHQWQLDTTFGSSSTERFKLDVHGDWSVNYGDDNGDGWAGRSEDDITISQGAGNYRISFNDSNFSYQIEKLPEGNVAPKALAGEDRSIFLGESLALDASASHDPDGSIVSYAWSTGLSEITGSVVLDELGSFEVSLLVTDNEGATGEDSFTVTVKDPNQKVSNFSTLYVRGTSNGWGLSAMTLVEDYTWQLDATFGSSIVERFKWDASDNWSQDYGDDNDNGWAGRSEDDIGITEGAGVYRITFNDSDLSYSVVKLPAGNQPPVADAGEDINLIIGETANFSAAASYDLDGQIVAYEWSNGLATVSGSELYTEVGVYTLSVTVTDNEGAQSTDTMTINVQATPLYPPVAVAGNDLQINLNESVSFDASQSSDVDGHITRYVWSHGGEGELVSHTFSEVGTFTVSLSVTDNDGLTATDELLVTVIDPNSKESNFETVYFRGTANAWAATAMTLVADNLWQIEAIFGGASSERFKFDRFADWSENYGDNNNDGLVDRAGENIFIHEGAGNYRITFNDNTMAYTLTFLDAVNMSPLASAGDDINIIVGETVTFNAAGSSDADGSIVSYAWSDGLSGVTATKTYNAVGTYVVTLTVTDNEGASASDTVTVTVSEYQNQAPIANAGNDITVNLGESAHFDATRSVDNDGSIDHYSWSNGLSGERPSKIYNTLGSVTVTLTVTDDAGASASDTVLVTVIDPNQKESVFDQLYLRGTVNAWGLGAMNLIANNTWQLEVQATGVANERFKFDVYGDWQYNLGDDNHDAWAGRSEDDIFITQGAGHYRVTINDSTLAYSVEKIIVHNQPPVAVISPDNITMNVNETVYVNSNGSYDPDGEIVSAQWSDNVSENNSISFEHFGEYGISLTVTDNAGGTATITKTVTVLSLAPLANAGADIAISPGEVANFDASASSDSDGHIVSYEWSNGLSGETATLRYEELGIYDVTLTVTDDAGITSSDIVRVVVQDMATHPVVTVSAAGFKTLSFDWQVIPDAAYYRLLKNVDGESGYITIEDNIAVNHAEELIAVHLQNWPSASYIVQACFIDSCVDSAPVFADEFMSDSIKYVRQVDATARRKFGSSIAFSANGNILAVGSIGSPDWYLTAATPSQVTLFAKTVDNSWREIQTIQISTYATDEFGHAVALSADGSTLVVSAHYDDRGGDGINSDESTWGLNKQNSGAVYVYSNSGSDAWELQAHIKASHPVTKMKFGHEISLSADGNALVVGTYYSHASNTDYIVTGAYVYERSGSQWVEKAILSKPETNPQPSDYFGESVAMSADGNTIIVGEKLDWSTATGVNGSGEPSLRHSGAAYLYKRMDNTWEQVAFIKASNPDEGDYFGSSVAINADGTRFAVGAINEASALVGINGDQSDNTHAHYSSGTDKYFGAGAVYLFNEVSAGVWEQQAYIKGPSTGYMDDFGGNLAFADGGNLLLVGAAGEDSGASGVNGDPFDDASRFKNYGAYYLYSQDEGELSLKTYIKHKLTSQFTAKIGKATISADGGTIAIGVPHDGCGNIDLDNPGAWVDLDCDLRGSVLFY